MPAGRFGGKMDVDYCFVVKSAVREAIVKISEQRRGSYFSQGGTEAGAIPAGGAVRGESDRITAAAAKQAGAEEEEDALIHAWINKKSTS